MAVVLRRFMNLPGQKKRRKFRNVPVVVDGWKFDSGKEVRRYEELLMKKKIGLIWNLRVKPPFKIMVNGQFLCYYTADFSYETCENAISTLVVEDTKGKDPKTGWTTRTPVYNLKKRLMRIVFGIEVREI